MNSFPHSTLRHEVGSGKQKKNFRPYIRIYIFINRFYRWRLRVVLGNLFLGHEVGSSKHKILEHIRYDTD